MKKLTLELDALRVESFATTVAGIGDAGTVRAHGDAGLVGAEAEEVAITTPPKTNDASCFDTCKASCWGTCEVSCFGSCDTCDDLCSLGCSDGCSVITCPTGSRGCCV
ncbi:MAG TPA: hypothetical protein VFR81_26000 [Longimicrobium sp.]|nr:hypothetical protein [Longimicrobium sp.]